MLSRVWESYFIKAVAAEPAEAPWPDLPCKTVEKHLSAILPGFEARIGRLPAPIISECATILDVHQTSVNGKTIRVYPPFPIDAQSETAGAFKRSWIPEGCVSVERYVAIGSSATLGFTINQLLGPGTFYCEGFRIDFESGADFTNYWLLLLENIGLHTHQWWLRGRTQPFRGMGRIGCEISSDFSLRELLKYKGAGRIDSPWHGVTETQKLLGIEKPLTNSLWLRCCDSADRGLRGDAGILSFHDAISYYMGNDDVHCIMSLSITVEILGNKRRILKGKKPTAFGELLKTSDLITAENRAVLEQLFIDRGHVTHGREPHLVGKKSTPKIEDYVEAVRILVSRYLNLIGPQEWPAASQLNIGRKKP